MWRFVRELKESFMEVQVLKVHANDTPRRLIDMHQREVPVGGVHRWHPANHREAGSTTPRPERVASSLRCHRA